MAFIRGLRFHNFNKSSLGKRFFSSNGSKESLLLYNEQSNIGIITLNNPKKRNALSFQMLTELKQQFKQIELQEKIMAVVLQANGTVFSSGHDLKEIQEHQQLNDRNFQEKLFHLCTEVMISIRELPKPVIASVNGLATAAGCQLVSMCDIVFATDKSSFATPGVKVGLFCTTPAVAVVRAINSTKKTMEMLLTGDAISAQEALQYGLVNRIYKEEEIYAKVLEFASKIVQTPPQIVALGKKAFYKQAALPITEAYGIAETYMVDNSMDKDCKEGIKAFVEKRNPSWK